MTGLQTIDPAPADLASQALGHRELISLAKSPSHWTHSAALALLGSEPVQAILAGMGRLHAELAPVPDEVAQRENWNVAVGERLKRLGAKIAPHLSEAQGNVWRDAVTEALSDLPALVVLTAAKRAIHRPMRFMSSAEGIVRQIAEELVAERVVAIARLKRLKDEIERAASPELALPPPPACEPMSPAEIHAMPPYIRTMGLNAGWLTQDEIDAATAMPETEQAEAA